MRTARDLILLFLLVCGAYWKLTLTDEYTWANQSDMSDQVLPWLQFQARQWQSGNLWPLWDPHHWGGQSLIGQLQPAVMYPLNWLLFLWPLNPDGFLSLRVLGWYLVLSRVLGAFFFYALVRDIGRSRLAAVFGGVLFACTGYVGTTEWPQVVNGAIWFPLVLLFGLRLLREKNARNGVFLGASLGMSVLAGHYQAPSHMLLFAGCLIGAMWLRRRSSLLAVRAGAAVAAFTFLIAAVQILPAREYWHDALRWIGTAAPVTDSQKVPYSVHATDSLDPVSITGIFVPRIYTALANPYAGFAALVLAVFGLAATWKSFRTRTIGAILLLFLLLSLGAATWFYGVAYSLLPGLDKSRHPAAAVAIWHPCLILLASIGMDRLRSPLRRKASFALFSFAAYVLAVTIYLSLADPPRTFGRNEQTMAAISALLLGGSLLGFHGGTARYACFFVALLEISNVAGYSYMHRDQGWTHLAPLYAEDRDVADFLRKEPAFGRVNFDRSEIPYNFGDWWGIDQYQGYTGVQQRVFRTAFEPETRKLLGESHWISKSPRWNGLQPAFESSRKLFVYRLADASPQVFLVPDKVCDLVPRLRTQTRVPGSWDIEVQPGSCGGTLVVNEVWASGWSATVNGIPAPLSAHRDLLLSLPVKTGTAPQSVKLRYRPRTVALGALLSTLGFAFVAFLALRGQRNRTRLHVARVHADGG